MVGPHKLIVGLILVGLALASASFHTGKLGRTLYKPVIANATSLIQRSELLEQAKVKWEEMAVDIKINFQPSDYDVPDGYYADNGDVYGDRGNGFWYGWSCDQTQNVKTKPKNAGDRDTTIVMIRRNSDDCTAKFTWEIALPEGGYRVVVRYANTASKTISTTGCTVEGVAAGGGELTKRDTRERIVYAKVEDGKLSFAGNFLLNTCKAISSIEITTAIDVSINFQPDEQSIPLRMLGDHGALFGDRENGYSYGWNCDQSKGALDRGKHTEDDTVVLMKKYPDCDNEVYWDLAVPNGEYEVVIRYGDRSQATQTKRCIIEGEEASVGTLRANNWVNWRGNVVVEDNSITLASAENLNYLSGFYTFTYTTPGGITGLWTALDVKNNLKTGNSVELFPGDDLTDCRENAICLFELTPVSGKSGTYNMKVSFSGKTAWVRASDASNSLVDRGNNMELFVGTLAQCGTACEIHMSLKDKDDSIFSMSVTGGDGESAVVQAYEADTELYAKGNKLVMFVGDHNDCNVCEFSVNQQSGETVDSRRTTPVKGCTSIASIRVYSAESSTSACQDLSIFNAYSDGESDVYPELCTVSNPNGDCPVKKTTYEDAFTYCGNLGARLPTAREMNAGQASDGKCSLDNNRVWTQTPCVTDANKDGRWAVAGNVNANGAPKSICLEESEEIFSRCVADIDLDAEILLESEKLCDDLGWDKVGDDDSVCAASKVSAHDTCAGIVSFSAAAAFCEAAGGRLGSDNELELGYHLEAGSSCGAKQADYVWGTEPCLASGEKGRYAWTLDQQVTKRKCFAESDTNAAYTVCFADTEASDEE